MLLLTPNGEASVQTNGWAIAALFVCAVFALTLYLFGRRSYRQFLRRYQERCHTPPPMG